MGTTIIELQSELGELDERLRKLGSELGEVNDKLESDSGNAGLKQRGENLAKGIEKAQADYDAKRREFNETLLAKVRGGETGLETGSEPGAGGARKAVTLTGDTQVAYTKSWAEAAAQRIEKTAASRHVKALTSGSVDIPSMVRVDVSRFPTNPTRLIDLIIDREPITGNEFAFLRQTVRTNNAAPVADAGTKPTSVFTVTEIEDRARVVAHLSEPVPERLLADHRSLVNFLSSEMGNGVLDALEAQIVSGNATGENMRGILNTVGIAITAFDTDIATSLRKGITAHQIAHEDPNALVLHPSDAEALDLLREGASGAFLVMDAPGNVLANIRRVVSTSVPAGTALLGDWTQVRLFVRQDVTIDADRSGTLFDTNQVKLRGEGRFGIGVLRPAAFRTVATTA